MYVVGSNGVKAKSQVAVNMHVIIILATSLSFP